MSYSKQLTLSSALLGLSLSLVPYIGVAQSTERPDLEGIWTNASRTTLTRPRGIEELVVSPMHHITIYFGYIFAGCLRGLIVGLLIEVIALLCFKVLIVHPIMMFFILDWVKLSVRQILNWYIVDYLSRGKRSE